MPPSKPPLLTLLKQARAFGLGMTLATQNPVDLDYKALANCRHLVSRAPADRARQGARCSTASKARKRRAGSGFDRARRRSTAVGAGEAHVPSAQRARAGAGPVQDALDALVPARPAGPRGARAARELAAGATGATGAAGATGASVHGAAVAAATCTCCTRTCAPRCTRAPAAPAVTCMRTRARPGDPVSSSPPATARPGLPALLGAARVNYARREARHRRVARRGGVDADCRRPGAGRLGTRGDGGCSPLRDLSARADSRGSRSSRCPPRPPPEEIPAVDEGLHAVGRAGRRTSSC